MGAKKGFGYVQSRVLREIRVPGIGQDAGAVREGGVDARHG